MNKRNNAKIFISVLIIILALALILIGTVGAISYSLYTASDSSQQETTTNRQDWLETYTDIAAQFYNIFMIISGILLLLVSISRIIDNLPKKQSKEDNNEELLKSIQTLHSLYEKGILTEEEFKERKALLLSANK